MRRLTLKDMKILAGNRNGECLSKNYINNRNKLKWRCNKGHTWYALPGNIKQGSWCPVCSKEKIL